MTPEERAKLIDQLDRSFLALPRWAKIACKHGMAAPTHHPETGKEFESFREVIEAGSDEFLLVIKNDFEDNEDLAPEELPPEPTFAKEGTPNAVTKEWVEWRARILTHHKEEVKTDNILEAVYDASDKVKPNFPNPEPGKLSLRVKPGDDCYQFYYAPHETNDTFR